MMWKRKRNRGDAGKQKRGGKEEEGRNKRSSANNNKKHTDETKDDEGKKGALHLSGARAAEAATGLVVAIATASSATTTAPGVLTHLASASFVAAFVFVQMLSHPRRPARALLGFIARSVVPPRFTFDGARLVAAKTPQKQEQPLNKFTLAQSVYAGLAAGTAFFGFGEYYRQTRPHVDEGGSD